nr:hypothetical protein CFP56_70359 [Quercus suber]
MAVTNMSLKLLIETDHPQSAFCEADKEFIDFLFHILRFPLRTIIPLLKKQGTAERLLSGGGGYVKGVVTYMIVDDLEVKPMSAISSITLPNKLNVKHIGALEEQVVELGLDEV